MKLYIKDFLIFLVIYDIGFAISALIAAQMTTSIVLQLLYLDILFTILIFIMSLIFKNSSLYDPYWSVVPPMLMAYALIKMDALTPLNLLVHLGIFIWALRLTYNWMVMWDGFKHQDWRYTMLKEKTGSLYPVVNFLGIHLFPTLIVFAQISVFLTTQSRSPLPLQVAG